MDYSLRIKASNETISWLDGECKAKKKLPRLHDYLFKPKDTSLAGFNPNEVLIRVCEFIEEDEPTTLVKLTIEKTAVGYTDSREDWGKGSVAEMLIEAEKRGFEKWGELFTQSVEYSVDVDGETVTVLVQSLKPVGDFAKIEAPSEKSLAKMLALLSTKKEDAIEKNAGVLLAEKMGLV